MIWHSLIHKATKAQDLSEKVGKKSKIEIDFGKSSINPDSFPVKIALELLGTIVLEPWPPSAATSPRDHPSVEPREARKPGAALEVRAVFQLLKYVKLFSFQRSCRLNTFPSFPMYLNTRGCGTTSP